MDGRTRRRRAQRECVADFQRATVDIRRPSVGVSQVQGDDAARGLSDGARASQSHQHAPLLQFHQGGLDIVGVSAVAGASESLALQRAVDQGDVAQARQRGRRPEDAATRRRTYGDVAGPHRILVGRDDHAGTDIRASSETPDAAQTDRRDVKVAIPV